MCVSLFFVFFFFKARALCGDGIVDAGETWYAFLDVPSKLP